jgi:hypothetical protein
MQNEMRQPTFAESSVFEIPLLFPVSREVIEPTIVTSSQSGIQTVPSPITTSRSERAHGSRSSRAGIFVSIVRRTVAAVALTGTQRHVRSLGYARRVLRRRLAGHRYRFGAEGATMRWSCERCGAGGEKTYATAGEAARYARAFDRKERAELGRRAPLLGMFPLRLVWLPRQRMMGR